MDADIVLDLVDYLNQNSVIFPCIDGGTWELSIYGNNGLG